MWEIYGGVGVPTGVDTDLAGVAGEQPARPAARHTAVVAGRVRLLGGVWGCGVYRGKVYMGVGVLTGVDTDLAGVAGKQPARPAACHTAIVAGCVRLLGDVWGCGVYRGRVYMGVGVLTGVDTDLAGVAGKQPARPAARHTAVVAGCVRLLGDVWGCGVYRGRVYMGVGVLTGVDTDLAGVAGEQPARPAARHTAVVAGRVRLLGGVWGCGVYRGEVYGGVRVLTGVDTDLAGVAGEQPARPAARHTAVVAGRVRLLGARREAHVWDERRR